MIIDDYDYWEGSRKAVDDFIADSGARLLLVPVDTANRDPAVTRNVMEQG